MLLSSDFISPWRRRDYFSPKHRHTARMLQDAVIWKTTIFFHTAVNTSYPLSVLNLRCHRNSSDDWFSRELYFQCFTSCLSWFYWMCMCILYSTLGYICPSYYKLVYCPCVFVWTDTSLLRMCSKYYRNSFKEKWNGAQNTNLLHPKLRLFYQYENVKVACKV
jgi:hypothetical protein